MEILFDEVLFEKLHCLNAVHLYLSMKQGICPNKSGLNKRSLENAQALLIEKGLLDSQEIEAQFEIFWQKYGKVGNKKNALTAFKRLNKTDRQMVMDNVAGYVLATPNKQYRKHAQGYLNGRMFDKDNYQKDKGTTTQPSDFNNVRKEALLNDLRRYGVVKDLKGNNLTTEGAVLEMLEKEKRFSEELTKVAQEQFGVPLHHPNIRAGGKDCNAFMHMRAVLIETIF